MAVDNLQVPVSAQRHRELKWVNKAAERLAQGATPEALKEEFEFVASRNDGVASAERMVEFARENQSSAWHAPLFTRPEAELAEERRVEIADLLLRSWKVVEVEVVGDKRSEVAVGRISMPKVTSAGGVRGRREYTKLTEAQNREAIQQRVRTIGYQLRDLQRYAGDSLSSLPVLRDAYEALAAEVKALHEEVEP